jgi:hypothetical protein
LQKCQSLFKRPYRPAILLAEIFNRLAFVIKRADVAHLDASFIINLFYPTQWQPLSAANIRAMGVDATTPDFVQESASAFLVRRLGFEQIPVMKPYVCGLDAIDRQSVNAASRAAATALKPLGMKAIERLS